LSTHKIQVRFLVLTLASQKRFLHWALEGFRISRLPSTRYNATKHGLLAKGVTELDDSEGHKALLQELMMEKKPVGPTEMFLVELVALDMVRAHRARSLEAWSITSILNPPEYAPDPLKTLLADTEIIDPGVPALINENAAQKLVNCFQRYESVFVARALRMLHELERLQRMRLGESLPAPIALDVIVRGGASIGAAEGLAVNDHEPFDGENDSTTE
jgi:hypothetical protein